MLECFSSGLGGSLYLSMRRGTFGVSDGTRCPVIGCFGGTLGHGVYAITRQWALVRCASLRLIYYVYRVSIGVSCMVGVPVICSYPIVRVGTEHHSRFKTAIGDETG